MRALAEKRSKTNLLDNDFGDFFGTCTVVWHYIECLLDPRPQAQWFEPSSTREAELKLRLTVIITNLLRPGTKAQWFDPILIETSSHSGLTLPPGSK